MLACSFEFQASQDVGKKDDFLGKAEIPFSQVAAHGTPAEGWGMGTMPKCNTCLE